MILGSQYDRITRLLPFIEPILDVDQAGSGPGMGWILAEDGLPNLSRGDDLSSLEEVLGTL